MTAAHEIASLLDRLSRLHGTGRRAAGLNPAQASALDYLARANRFSRTPSAVADYLSATRGTISQTLKSLAAKGLAEEGPGGSDRRSRRYDLTPQGRAVADALDAKPPVDLPDRKMEDVRDALRQLVRGMIKARGGRSFGLCRSCRHHRTSAQGAHCALLDVPLQDEETTQICQEHEPGSAENTQADGCDAGGG
ncbi:MarR family winged helix-turn-helix transcriptional regulator [Leisingera aquaemixtae]|uniref:MarR family winged helix-turn-helix transcriptional regulator n=1 Tax=Leisingera aquaemixtae TaxID=1396826 RepID=UPI001C9743C5|nr:MarR family winged helix-turn-helix transcriptional regulator [Leisingera aquaemixtae]MBY6068596.1 MarR family winged helix-turn-helix transcriptional regulator [Leisingera aquaemixtae]